MEGIEKSDTIITQYRYDDIGRLQHESTPYRKNDEINWTQYIYDRADRITRIIYPGRQKPYLIKGISPEVQEEE